MANYTPKSRTKYIVLAIIALIVVATVLIIVVQRIDQANQTEVDEANLTASTENTNSDTIDGKTPSQYEGEEQDESNATADLSGYITHAELAQGALQIRLEINQIINTGSCKLKLGAPSGKTIEQDATIIANPNSSTCTGFEVPTSQITESGAWKIEVSLSSGDKSGSIFDVVQL